MDVARQTNTRPQPDMVLFFPAYADESFTTVTCKWHLGTAYIIANAQQRGYAVEQFVDGMPSTLDHIVDGLLAQAPRLIGVTVYDVNYHFAAMICREIKRRSPATVIVAGGPSPTFSDGFILGEDNGIDICVRGEGEFTALELIDAIANGSDWSPIPGISFRHNGEMNRTPDRELLTSGRRGAELDELPSPYLTGVLPTDQNLGLLTSRGCVYHCTYCNFSSMSRWRVRSHSVDRVVAEMRWLSQHHDRDTAVPIQDDTFTLDLKRSKEICRRIIDEELDLRFWCETRADRVDRELLGLMGKAGVETIHFGVESANAKNLRTVKKLSSGSGEPIREQRFLEQVEEHVRTAREFGLGVTMSVIVGLPGENLGEATETIEFVRSLRPDYYYHNDLVAYPGTELFDTADDHGIGIVPSSVGLPYRTVHSFDVAQVPVLPWAIHHMTILESSCDRALGLLAFNRAPESAGISALVIGGSGRCTTALAGLAPRLTLAPILLRIGDAQDNEHVLDELLGEGLPTVTFMAVQPGPDDGARQLFVESAINARRSRPRRHVADLQVVPFSRLDESTPPIGDKPWRRVALLTIDNEADLRAFRSALGDVSPIARLRRRLDSEILLCNQCRWEHTTCPAFDNNIVAHHLQQGPCRCTAELMRDGPIPEPWLDRQGLEEQRGCAGCPAAERCSRCQRLGPMSVEEYCRLQVANAAAGLLETLVSINDLSRHARQWLFSADSEA